VSVTATGINNNGDVSGFYSTASGRTVSFLKRGRKFTTFSFPRSTNTMALGVNSAEEVAGVYADSAGKMHGFLAKNVGRDARFQSIDDPNGVGTSTVNGLNDRGDLVGFYVDGAGNTNGMLAMRS
jgi:hypothetical protein